MHLYVLPKQAKLIYNEMNHQWLSGVGGETLHKGTEEIFWGEGNVLKLH